MNEPKHTKEPWQSGGCVVWQTDGDMICDLSRTRRLPDTIEANTERIVNCVNACEGINPAAVKDLLAALIETTRALETHLRDERKRLDLVLAVELCPCESGELTRAHAAIRKATGEGE